MSLYRSLSILGALATSEFGKIDPKLVLSFVTEIYVNVFIKQSSSTRNVISLYE